MVTEKKLESILKSRYNLCVGVMTLEKLRCELAMITKTKVKVSGRSYETGRKKTITVPVKIFLAQKKPTQTTLRIPRG